MVCAAQLVDYDRMNNSYTKLKDKKEKSVRAAFRRVGVGAGPNVLEQLSDEKNLFKLEQDLEQATAEYEHYNSLVAPRSCVGASTDRSFAIAHSSPRSLTSWRSRRPSSPLSSRPSTLLRSASSVLRSHSSRLRTPS